jgi:hypothetical protein
MAQGSQNRDNVFHKHRTETTQNLLSGRLERGRSFFILSCESWPAASGLAMPSLFRFLTAVAIMGVLIYGGMFALATWFDPTPREITVSVPPDKFSKQR